MASLAPEFAAQLLAWLGARDTTRIDIPVIQPADALLDMAGESLRGRIFLTESETGEPLCLRPEFTIPVCRDHVAGGGRTPKRYAYLGEVFRQRRAGGSEFFQAGIEDIGDTDTAGADARSLADALGLVSTIAPDAAWCVTVGDQAVFEAVVSALGLPRGWR
ncbi:MAG: ATP phosphoribosyltransferase regulatory subunit, partial [Pseudomonadota bacterium]|nr:ATP phosphoribosyltransferase regulatory subunit [Pseudomonadota bacterium]